MNFQDATLVKKYGSWVRVQVEFYDFLFATASEMCAKHFREAAVDSFASGGFSDENRFYEFTIGTLETMFSTFKEAWKAFLEAEGKE